MLILENDELKSISKKEFLKRQKNLGMIYAMSDIHGCIEELRWIRNMPAYYDADDQIFVHAGVDEEAGEYWMWGTSDDLLLGKFPASKGKFYKTIVAGHVGTGTRDLANDRSYHDVYYDGESHYYIDGSVYKGGKLLLLGYDESDGKYYQIESNRKIPVRKYEEYVSLD